MPQEVKNLLGKNDPERILHRAARKVACSWCKASPGGPCTALAMSAPPFAYPGLWDDA